MRVSLLSRLLVLILIVVFVGPAWAWTESVSWDATPGATWYLIEKSTDNGATWAEVIFFPSGRPTTPAFIYTGSEPGLVLFRLSNCNSITCETRPRAGIWHNESAPAPLSPPSNTKMQ